MKIALIAAIDENNGIGKNNQLLCHLPADLKHFKMLTTGHSIIMGRKTFESLPNGPLPNRKNIVLTQNANYKASNCIFAYSIKEVLEICKEEPIVFVIGGEKIYKEFLAFSEILYITSIKHVFEADAFFPEIEFNQWRLKEEVHFEADEKNKFPYTFQVYNRIGKT
jgi:dihydrofolate reductase